MNSPKMTTGRSFLTVISVVAIFLWFSNSATAFWPFSKKEKEPSFVEKIDKKFKAYEKQKDIKQKQKNKIESVRKENIKESLKIDEEEAFTFVKYNNPPGSNELDFFGIYGKRQINTKGVISPDFTKLVYSEVHFYPSVKQVSSELFLINLSNQKRVKRRVLDANIKDRRRLNFYGSGMSKVEDEYFRTLMIVDWSADSSRLLIKERIAENLRGFLQTRVWVYDFYSNKNYMLKNLRPRIAQHYRDKGVELNDCRWDINPIGWFKYQRDRIIVDVYVYKKDKTKMYLGAWLAGYKDGSVLSLSENQGEFPVVQNGLVLKRKRTY